jgi:hypothetical protein
VVGKTLSLWAILRFWSRVPPIGGIILAQGESGSEIAALLSEDPFQQEGCADYEVFEFTPNPLTGRSLKLDAFVAKSLEYPPSSDPEC